MKTWGAVLAVLLLLTGCSSRNQELDRAIPQLEEEKRRLEALLGGGTSDPKEIAAAVERFGVLTAELEEKEMRWLELSEIGEA